MFDACSRLRLHPWSAATAIIMFFRDAAEHNFPGHGKQQREHTGSKRNRALQIHCWRRGTADVEKCRCEHCGPRPITQCGLHQAPRSALVLAHLGNVRNREVPRHLRDVYRRGVGVFRASESSDCFFGLVFKSRPDKKTLGRCARSLLRNVRKHATRVMPRTWQSLLLHGQW